MKRTPFTPVPGEVYKNSGGGSYRCLRTYGLYCEYDAVMQNISNLWTFTAKGCGVYPDGSIDWNHSTGGYFSKGVKACHESIEC